MNPVPAKPQKLDRKALRGHEDRILKGLVGFYYESGHRQFEYTDEQSGGLYEAKLAQKLGYELEEQLGVKDRPPAHFVEACRVLAVQGYVKRRGNFGLGVSFNIWPTPAGLDRVEYLESSRLSRAWIQIQNKWPEVLVAAITTIITLLISWLLGLFGLGGH